MKRFVLLIVAVAAVSFGAYTQNPLKLAQVNFSELSPDMKVQYQVDYVRHCLKKYRNEKMTGYKLEAAGLILSGAGFVIVRNRTEDNLYRYGRSNNTTVSTGLMIGGGALSLVGIISIIDSEKWLKRAYVGPDGLGVKFSF
jgi:hypothetical protein